MSIIVKKKQLLAATLIIALGMAAAVNWYYRGNTDKLTDNQQLTSVESGMLGDSLYVAGTAQNVPSPESTEKDDTEDYFAKARLNREKSNDAITDKAQEILDKDELKAEDKAELEKLFEEYQKTIKLQTDAENLICAKTGSPCLVIINDGSCQVIMEKNSLSDHIVLQITEIIEKNTDIFAENLTIIEAK